MRKSKKAIPARERILKTAEELFYKQGYLATGINQIIDESGVAKATFYANFPSKETLCLTYLNQVSEDEFVFLEKEIAKHKTPIAQFMCIIESLEPWLEANQLKGCNFLNMVPEVTDAKHPIRKAGVKHYDGFKAVIGRLSKELIRSDKKKYGHLNATKLARDYVVVMTGAMQLTSLYHDIQPMAHGIQMVRQLIK